MMEKTCRCGKSKKNFNIDIGPFFIADCCIEAGYNHLGERFEVEDVGLKAEEVQKAIETADQLQVIDDVKDEDDKEEETAEETPTEEVKSEDAKEKKKRQYNRNGKIKTQT